MKAFNLNQSMKAFNLHKNQGLVTNQKKSLSARVVTFNATITTCLLGLVKGHFMVVSGQAALSAHSQGSIMDQVVHARLTIDTLARVS